MAETNVTDTTTFFPDTDSITDPTTTNNNTTTTTPHSSSTTPTTEPQILTNPSQTIHIELTHSPLSLTFASTFTRSPTAGATAIFLGTTRSYFLDPSRPVSRLSYSAYPALALRTLLNLATAAQTSHNLEKICIVHRLGEVAVGEESIIVAVSTGHRGPAWEGAQELLERVKERAEIWKREWFVDGAEVVGRDGEMGTEVGVWRDNRESDRMGRRKKEENEEEGVDGR